MSEMDECHNKKACDEKFHFALPIWESTIISGRRLNVEMRRH